ncbi:DUF2203 family protein [Spirosoma montaniterrae]|uniref:DUF3782 domain-containing protein n=1 Tax=Spirosoma montaniterrae TaxID=1178516 RepID=A0A1P9WXP2_9BACT|nr:DUF2203 family protein [Spirosoma montaniterrae]AQG80131.1 hypothetical protein AWR27_12835 [Spirosoma montaniterrae]
MEANTSLDEIRAILREITEKQREITEKQREMIADREQQREQEHRERQQAKRETDKEINRVAKIVGDIGNKFGSFTEGMAFPSMERVLRRKFGMTDVAMRYKTQRGGDTMEIDVLGLANGDVNTAVLVEVKSHLKERDIEQILQMLDRFVRFFPEHRHKKIYGILAFVDGAEEVRQQATRAGLYTAPIHDEVFDLLRPKGFTPRDFSQEPVTA